MATGLTHIQSSLVLLITAVCFFLMSLQLQELAPTSFMILAAIIAIAFTLCIHLAIALQSSQSLRTDP